MALKTFRFDSIGFASVVKRCMYTTAVVAVIMGYQCSVRFARFVHLLSRQQFSVFTRTVPALPSADKHVMFMLFQK